MGSAYSPFYEQRESESVSEREREREREIEVMFVVKVNRSL